MISKTSKNLAYVCKKNQVLFSMCIFQLYIIMYL